MGRRIPDDNLSLSLILHPVLYLSFVAVGVVASIAIVTSLCSILTFWKKPSSEETKKGANSPAPAAEGTETTPPGPQGEEAGSDNETGVKELPLPPAMQYQGNNDSYASVKMKRAASERKMSFNLSIKMPRTSSVARMSKDHLKEEAVKKMKGKHQEDSVWMKTIILGGKCQVPDDQNDAVIYERKGKKVEAYHPKTRSSMSCSNISFIDPDEAPQGPQPQNQEEINHNKS